MTSDKSRTELISKYINGRIPLIGVGGIHTPNDAIQVLAKGNTDFVSIGRAIVVDPHWVEKIMHGEEESIVHYLTEQDQQNAVIPTPLWKLILEVKGWFPVK